MSDPAHPTPFNLYDKLIGVRGGIGQIDDLEPWLAGGHGRFHCWASSSSMSNTERYSSKIGSKSARVTPDPSNEYGAAP